MRAQEWSGCTRPNRWAANYLPIGGWFAVAALAYFTFKTKIMKLENQFTEVVQLIKQARSNAYKAISVELINCYWQVGEYISKRIAQAT